MKILKFGGTSLGNEAGFSNMLNIVSKYLETEQRIIVVISAFEGVTDQLFALAHKAANNDQSYFDDLKDLEARHFSLVHNRIAETVRESVLDSLQGIFTELRSMLEGVSRVRDLTPKTLAFIASCGERAAAFVVSETIRPSEPSTQLVDSRELILTDGGYVATQVRDKESFQRIRAHLAWSQTRVSIVTGYIAANERKETTTLGRGGSDYTATLIGAALKASEVEIWTHVDGFMTGDPEKVEKAITIPQLRYDEALELTHFGARIISPIALRPAIENGIPLRIRNTFRPEQAGSRIGKESPPADRIVTGISAYSNVTVIRLQGDGVISVTDIAGRLFSALAKDQVNVILTSQASSEHSLCVAVNDRQSAVALTSLEKEFALELQVRSLAPIDIERNQSIVAAVGVNMRNKPGISGRLFQALGKNGINVRASAQGSSELNISVVISQSDEAKALNALHDAFFLSDVKTVHLFLVGLGNVGNKLLSQISSHGQTLREERALDIRVVGLANSKRMKLDRQGLTLQAPKQLLENGEHFSMDAFVQVIRDFNLPNSIFVDCSASADVADAYPNILAAAVSIVTPNKKANSASYAQYQALKQKAAQANVKFFYETTVGAGLPVIGTLQDLLASGDKIIRIEAVLSGTLSFLFNTFQPGTSFSEIVREAKAKGYTEPDPRDDLSGADVARKLLILSREMGLALEPQDVQVSSLIPANCETATSVEEFFVELQKSDAHFQSLLEQAAKDGGALRYIAAIDQGVAKVQLQAVPPDHPFLSLSGSDNIIAFVTERYSERPLVVKGPGAGVDVTAAGVFADIIRVASYLS